MRSLFPLHFLIFLTGFVMLTKPGSAQVTFQRTYGGVYDDFSSDVFQTGDGGYLLSGISADSVSWNYLMNLIKLNQFGDTIWTRKYLSGLSPMRLPRVAKTADEGVIISGISNGDLYLIRADSLGDTLWTKRFFGETLGWMANIQQTFDGGYITAGNYISITSMSDDMYLIKTDANGDTIWTKTYGLPGVDVATAVVQTSDSGYVILGKTPSSVTDFDLCLIKTDSAGDVEWAKAYGAGFGTSIQQTFDGGFIVSTIRSLVLRTDPNGDTLWTKDYNQFGLVEGASIKQTMDGGFILFNNIEEISGNKTQLIRLDGYGDTVWTKIYGDINNNLCVEGGITSDGGFIVSGIKYFSNPVNYFLIKTDSMGRSGCAESSMGINVSVPAYYVYAYQPIVGTFNINVGPASMVVGHGGNPDILCLNVGGEESPDHQPSFVINPNPTNQSFTISGEDVGHIEIYSSLGELVLKLSINSPHQNIPVSFQRGIYFVKIQSKERYSVQKLIVE